MLLSWMSLSLFTSSENINITIKYYVQFQTQALKNPKVTPRWHFIIGPKIKEKLKYLGTNSMESWNGHMWSYAW